MINFLDIADFDRYLINDLSESMPEVGWLIINQQATFNV